MRYRYYLSLAMTMAWATTATAQWQPHTVRQLNGAAAEIGISAKVQIVTESWNRVATVPYLAYMPENDRLLMLLNCDYPHQAMLMSSNDRGSTWSSPTYLHQNAQGQSDIGMGVGLTYLGQGKVMTYADDSRWSSDDYGTTWTNPVAVAATPDGYTWSSWDPMLVQRNLSTGAVTRLMESGYAVVGPAGNGPGYERAYLRSSTDGGQTWGNAVQVPQWQGVSEVNFLQAANGNLVAACRTDISTALPGQTLDWYEGLGVSISQDGGNTWSNVNKLYDYGRHHPSLLLMPDNDIVMTYVVRLGYPDTPDGYPQFGIEAVVSHDNGDTWDLDHRYVLDTWVGNRPSSDPNFWYAGPFNTSSALLPDGSILTAFGTGYREETGPDGLPIPRDIGLVQWRLTEAPEPSTFVLAVIALLGTRLFARQKHFTRRSCSM